MINFNKDVLFDKMCELSKDGYLSIQKSDLARACGFEYSSSSRFIKAIQELENSGKILIIQKASRNGQKYWSNFIWKIVKNDNNDDASISKINADDFIIENFKNIEMKIYKTDKGWVVPIVNIANALKVDRQTIHDLVDRNIELFNKFLVSITLTASKSGENRCLTRDGVIGLIMKISLKRLPDDKKKLVLEFQDWAIKSLDKLIVEGKVELSEQEHAKIQTQLGGIIELNDNQIDSLFLELDKSVSQIVDKAKSTIKQLSKDKKKIEYEKDILKKENQKWINNTLALKEKILNLQTL